VALFPDAVTERGARHVKELGELARKGEWEAAVLFVVQRSDARLVRAARSIDPKFAQALEDAKLDGLRILGRRCHVFLDRVELGAALPADVG
jgi:sugar fermentation stimulation protein A